MVQLYGYLIMFLLLRIIIPQEYLFLKMRNSHSLLKALDFNSFAQRNMLFFSNIKKKFPKPPPPTRFFSKISYPSSLKIFISLLPKILISHYQRSIYMDTVFLSPLVECCSLFSRNFFPSLQVCDFQVLPLSLSLSLSLFCYTDLFLWVLPFSHPCSLFLRIFYSALSSAISTGTTPSLL